MSQAVGAIEELRFASIIGGSAESIAFWSKSIGHEIWFSYYLTSIIAVALLVALTMRDTKRCSFIGRHE